MSFRALSATSYRSLYVSSRESMQSLSRLSADFVRESSEFAMNQERFFASLRRLAIAI